MKFCAVDGCYDRCMEGQEVCATHYQNAWSDFISKVD